MSHNLDFGEPPVPTPGPVGLVFGDDTPAPRPRGLLLFERPPVATPGPVHLVFGDDDDAPAAPNVTLSGAGKLSGLRLRIGIRSGVSFAGLVRITGLRIRIAAQYDINVSRPTVGCASAHWQDAATKQQSAATGWQQAAPRPAANRGAWEDAGKLAAALLACWHDTERRQRALLARYEQALRQPSAPLCARYEEALRLRNATGTGFQEARRQPAAPLRGRYQETYRDRQARIGAGFQEATSRTVAFRSGMGIAVRLHRVIGGRFQEAWFPRPGQWVRPPPPQPEPCYLPALPARLVFEGAYDPALPARLVFICERAAPPPEPGATVVVPIRRVYVTVNQLTLVRASDGAPIPCASFGMSLDVDSWTWQWQGSLGADALPLIAPEADGSPRGLLATVNGVVYHLVCENYTRSRQFPTVRINARGRGRAAVLDAPYAPALNFGNTVSRTAQQLMGDVLTINGVGIGWDVEWNLTDWLVPANTWALQGAYIAGVLDIANAAGGYVQPHDTAQTLRILPRYPAAPWDWASLTPDFELPAAVVAVEGTEWLQKPNYNRVFVSGTSAGVLGQVTRTGTAGDAVAPMVTHPLITHADAARQRGMAELSDTGRQARLSLRMPVLAETGVIQPGALVRYVDNGVPALGLVRGTQVDWSRPTLRQVLDVETHPA